MNTIAEFIAFCQEQGAFHSAKASARGYSEKQHASHAALAAKFAAGIQVLEEAKRASELPVAPAQVADEADSLFEIDPFDLGGLPEELVEELSISAADQQDAQIVQLLRIAKRPLSINEILVGLYRKFSQQHKRNPLSARLYRIAQKGDIVSVDKGVYALPEKSPRQGGAKPADEELI